MGNHTGKVVVNWEHKCSLDWLKMRQHYLTASDVKRLLPVTNTGRKRNVGTVDYLKVAASKLRELTEEDCVSYGAAARGHILEPYAIDILNQELSINKVPKNVFWWDDEIIPMHPYVAGSLAFSPDGLDILPADYHEHAASPAVMAEVKCYSDEHHLVTAFTPKEKLEERWQIATGMAVCLSIERAYLVLFDPDLDRWNRCFIIEYEREDLEDEIETVLEIEESWAEFLKDYSAGSIIPPKRLVISASRGAQQIEEEVLSTKRLNP
jgi:hypothetical protein